MPIHIAKLPHSSKWEVVNGCNLFLGKFDLQTLRALLLPLANSWRIGFQRRPALNALPILPGSRRQRVLQV